MIISTLRHTRSVESRGNKDEDKNLYGDGERGVLPGIGYGLSGDADRGGDLLRLMVTRFL